MKNRKQGFSALILMLIIMLLSVTVVCAVTPGGGGSGSVTVDGYTLGVAWTSTGIGNNQTPLSEENWDASVEPNGNIITLKAKNSTKARKWTIMWYTTYYAQDVRTFCQLVNNTQETLLVTYAASGEVTLPDGVKASDTVELAPGDTYPASGNGFYVTKDVGPEEETASYEEGTITISKIEKASNPKLTFYSSNYGAVNYTSSAQSGNIEKNGEPVANLEFVAGTTVNLAATVDQEYSNEYSFYGWMSGGVLISKDNPYDHVATKNASIYPVFLPTGFDSSGPFSVDGTRYMFWHQACAAASSSSSKRITLVANYTLPTALEENGLHSSIASSYTNYVSASGDTCTFKIPSGLNFLVPYGSGDSGNFGAEPGSYLTEKNSCSYLDEGGITARNFVHVCLTVPEGAKIECSGNLNVNGQRQKDGQPYTGVTLGGYGKIHLEAAGSEQIAINNGAKLYCYGYITGTGLVNVKNGGAVHEFMQACDWPGGSNADEWNNSKVVNASVFPLSQYYIQNIESKLQINFGAAAYVEFVVTGSGITVPASAPYIGTSEGLFILTSGSHILREYNADTDRMTYHLNGNISFGSLKIYKKVGSQTVDLDSSEYVLPIGNNMTISVENGAVFTMAKQAAVMPGAEVVVQTGAVANLTGKLYIVDVNDWTRYYFFNRVYIQKSESDTSYAGANASAKFAPVPYVASRNGYSARVTGYIRGVTVSKNILGTTVSPRYYMTAVNCTNSGKVVVNGTLNISGNGILCTTKQTTKVVVGDTTYDGLTTENANKVIDGTGMINYETVPTNGTLKFGYNATQNSIATVPAVANIAGIGTLKSFATGTYYGQPNGYWYNYLVKADTDENAAKFTFVDTNLSGSTVSRYNGTAAESIPNVLGLVSSYWDGSKAVQSTTTFSMAEGTDLAMSSTGKIPAMALSETGYTLSKFNGDVTLGTGGENSTTVGFVASNAKPAMIKNLSVVFPAGSDLSNYYSDSMLGTPASSGNVGYTVYTDGGEAVAAIGPSEGNYAYAFAKVSDAVSTATGGNTYVTVLKDRSLTDPITVASGQNITLDLGGKTLDGGSDKAKEPLTNNGILRLINGTITYKAAYRTGSDGKGDMSQELMTATVRNNGTIEYIDNVTLKEMYSSASVYVTPLMNCTGATIKEIRSGSFVGTSMSNGGVGIMNFGTINTIGANEEEITFYNRRGIVCAKGTISTIGGAGSTIKITHGQRGIETLAAGTITTIGVDRSKIEIINDASHKMVKSGIYSAGTIGTIGGKGSSIDISINVTATHIYANYGINIASGSVGVIGDSESVITITGTTAQNLDTAYSIYGLWNYKGTITTLGTTGSQIYVNVSHTGNGDAYGIMNQKTVETLGASGSVIEVVSNKYGIYNSGSISSLGGDLVAVSTDTTGSYYALYNAGTITSINSGDYYHASGRANAVYNPDSQKYPAGYDLSTTTRNVALVDGSHYPCYYLAKSGAGIITSEEPGGAPATPENQGILGDIIADYLELSESERNDSYIVLTQNCDEPTSITLTGDVYLDLNGHSADLTGFELGKYNLYVIDSATNAYLTNDGDKAGYIVGFDGASAVHTSDRGASKGKHYVQVEGENGIEFHRAAVSVTTIQYTPGQDYAVFQGVFRGTSDVVTALKDVGFRFNEETDVWYNMTDKNATAIYDMPFSYACKLEGVDSVQALLSFAEEPTEASMIVSTLRERIAELIKGASE